jgi:hypothetical protein
LISGAVDPDYRYQIALNDEKELIAVNANMDYGVQTLAINKITGEYGVGKLLLGEEAKASAADRKVLGTPVHGMCIRD